jgi:hypothetical protein
MSEIVGTTTDGTTRVRLVQDVDAGELYDDGGAPIWRVEGNAYGGWRVEHVDTITSFEPNERIAEAIAQLWSEKDEVLERYLRIFHGVTITERWHSGTYWYFTCDPAQWREHLGLTPENVAGFKDPQYSLMSEYKAWVNGEVYGYIVEEKVRWQRVDEGGTPTLTVEPNQRETWEEVESCYGYYGYHYAMEEATEILAVYEKDNQ